MPAPTLAGCDDPNHKEMRSKFNEAFRPKPIKAWTGTRVQRLGLMQTKDEVRWSVEIEIWAQHYVQEKLEALRKALA